LFCITHSAQIAAIGDTHFKIAKSEVDGRNETTVTPLSGEARIDEISRIMGGIEITETLRRTAKEMLDSANEYRA
jgi:DNA repair protein RecN (Recombination protein N)